MLTVIMGLTCALLAGGADFIGGVASKRMSAFRVTATVALTGLAVLIVASVFLGGTWSPEAALWGTLSGISIAIGLSLLYACLAIGPMSILSPLTAVVSATIPMIAGLIGGERLGLVGYLALGTALVAVVLVGLVPEKHAVRVTPRALVMAVTSGTMIGIFLILLDMTPADSGLVPLLFNRAAMALAMFAMIGSFALLARRNRRAARSSADEAMSRDAAHRIVIVPIKAETRRSDGAAPPTNMASTGDASRVVTADLVDEAAQSLPRSRFRSPVAMAVGAGILDASAITALLVGMRVGDLTVISVLNAMYPGGTIILAAILLRERIARLQVVGLILALAAAGMLALA